MHYKELDKAWQELTAPGAAFEMETLLILGAQTRVFKHAPRNIRDLWLPTASFANRDYIIFENERVSYSQAHDAAAACANWLLQVGVQPGDRVAIAMRNYPEWLLIYWGCVSIGVCVVGINAWWTGDEIAFAMKDSAPKVVFCDRERMDRMLERPAVAASAKLVIVKAQPGAEGATAWDEVLAVGGGMPEVDVDRNDDACIFYTSGTTGTPKGAQLTHLNCVTNIYNIMFGGQVQALAHQLAGAAMSSRPSPPRAVSLIPTPFFHVTGSTCLGFSITLRGGTMVLMYKWDSTEALALIEREKITELSGVPVMSREILGHPKLADYDTSSLTSVGGGGASFQADLIDKVANRLPSARARTGYGMTETSGSITTVLGDFLVDKPNSVGRALPTFDVRLVDEAGHEVSVDGIGELWVRGGAVIKGYLNAPEETAKTISDGWLHTGDLARIDEEGFIYIVDRIKDMVIRGGENVYCSEVENRVQAHPAVAECCVFGITDDRLGEAVGAAIVLMPGATLTEEEIVVHCMKTLARHKIPSRIWFLDQPLPRNATGKFMKREVRESLATDLAV